MLQFLTDLYFGIVSLWMLTATDPKDADIIWTSIQVDDDMKKATGIKDNQYVNQFPFEACLVMKHHLAETVQKVMKQTCYFFLLIKELSLRFIPLIKPCCLAI